MAAHLCPRGQGADAQLTLGHFPTYSLADAREWRADVRGKLERGETVGQAKPEPVHKLEDVAAQWYARWSPERTAQYREQVWRFLERWVFSQIGQTPIASITPADVVACLRKMEAHGTLETLRKTKNSLGMIFAFAVGSGLIEYNPIKQIDNSIFKRAHSEHMRALTPDQLPLLIDFLEQRGEFATGAKGLGEVNRLAIYWLLLTMTRVQETVKAKWSEMDLAAQIWTIPADRKKERREHIVPLVPQMIEILDAARSLNVHHTYIFESHNFKTHLHTESPRMAMQRAGLDTTAHGLRSLARTYLREKLHISDDVAEKLLAHSLGTKTQTAYNRSQLLDERRAALEQWGDVIWALKNK